MSMGINMEGIKKALLRTPKTPQEIEDEKLERETKRVRAAELNKIYEDKFHEARKDVVRQNAIRDAKENKRQQSGFGGIMDFGRSALSSEQASMRDMMKGGSSLPNPLVGIGGGKTTRRKQEVQYNMFPDQFAGLSEMKRPKRGKGKRKD